VTSQMRASPGPQFHGRKAAVQARHEAVLTAIRAAGAISLDDLYPAVRRACGATRTEVKCSIARLLERAAIEVAERGNRSGRATTWRVKEGTQQMPKPPVTSCSTPSATPVTWRVTEKMSGQSVDVSETLWITARDTGARLLGVDRYAVTCERVEVKEGDGDGL
jgi:hypothetical protein